MRSLILLTISALLGCGAIYSPAGCPPPCPAACPRSCLPSGYCASAHWQPPASPVLEYPSGQTLHVELGDLPPHASVALSVDAVVDFDDRDGTVPWDYSLDIQLQEQDGGVDEIIDQSMFDAVDFPVSGGWSGPERTSGSGALDLNLLVATCNDRIGRPATSCAIFLPATAITAQLVDTGPWEEPPECP